MGIIFALALAFILTSCQQKTFDTQEELMAYVTNLENGYTQKKSVNGIDFSITYRPTDLVVNQMARGKMSNKQIDSLRNKFEEYLYFNISLSKQNQEILANQKGGKINFSAMVNQLAFGMGEKVHLFNQKKDTVELIDYVYPRLYGMGGSSNILFVYPRKSILLEDEFIHFTIEDLGLKTGEVSFKIPTGPLKKEPRLDYKKI